MNNEYIKIGTENYVVSDENGVVFKRTVKSPELFKYENDVEIVNNEIKSLKLEKQQIKKDKKNRNIRHFILYLPAFLLIDLVCAKNLAEALFISQSADMFAKIGGAIFTAGMIIATSMLVTDTIFSNAKATERRKEIDKSLIKAKALKGEYERKLENFKSKSIIFAKDNTKVNEKVSLKSNNEYRAFEIQKAISPYDYEDEVLEEEKGYTLTKKR